MSRGVFNLLDSLHGKQEVLLTATKRLYERINDIYKERVYANKERIALGADPVDPRATLIDIAHTHVFFVKAEYKPYVALGYDYFKTTPAGANTLAFQTGSNGDNKIRFPIANNTGHFLNDMVLHMRINSITSNTLRYRYCAFPGICAVKKVSLIVDGEVLCEYTRDDVIAIGQLRIPSDKLLSWYRGVGQEVPHDATYYSTDLQLTQHMTITDGAQTAKNTQPELELWIPLLFWFNVDSTQSFMNSMIMSDQKYIDITLADTNEIIQTQDSTGAIVANSFNQHKILEAALYTKNIYLNNEVHDLFVNRNNLSVIRVIKNQISPLNTSNGLIKFDALKYPIEQIAFGFIPLTNLTNFDNWYKRSNITNVELPIPAIINNPLVAPVQQLVIRTATYTKCTPLATQLGFVINGNKLYPLINSGFYNTHIPFTFDNTVSPSDCGMYLITFNMNNQFNPSGHFNSSQARDFYLQYVAPLITMANPVNFIATAQCINFMIFSRGMSRLRYLT